MFKLIKKIPVGYRQHLAIDELYLYLAKENELTKVELTSESVCQNVILHEKIDSLTQTNDDIIVYFSSKSKRIKKDGLMPIDDAGYDDLIPYQLIPFDNLQLILVGEDIFDRQCGVYDIEEKKILWVNGNVGNPIILNGNLFANLDNKVERFDLNTGSLIWSRLIQEHGKYDNRREMKSHDGEVDNFLGIYNGAVWICLKNGLLIGLDIVTGSVLHQVGAPQKYPPELYMLKETIEQNFFYNHQSVFDEKNGKIIRVWHAGYSEAHFDWSFEVDLNKPEPEVVIEKIENTTGALFSIDGGPSPIFPFDDEFIYTCNFRDRKIALFNRDSKKIEWVHEIGEGEGSFITKMEVKNNRWYIQDYSQTLRVYERVTT
jgi:hypothetical protein